MRAGKFTNFCTDAAEAIETGGRKIPGETELFKENGFDCRDFGWGRAGVQVADQFQESADERRVRVGVERTAVVVQFRGDPCLGNAAFHAVGLCPVVFVQWRHFAGIVHDGGKTLLWIVDDGVVLDQLLLFFDQGHAKNLGDSTWLASVLRNV